MGENLIAGLSGRLASLFSAQGTGEGAVRMEPDDAGLQSEARAQPGEL